MRADVAAGCEKVIRIVDGLLVGRASALLDANAADIAAKRAVMVQAREEERRRWSERGEFGIKEGRLVSATIAQARVDDILRQSKSTRSVH